MNLWDAQSLRMAELLLIILELVCYNVRSKSYLYAGLRRARGKQIPPNRRHSCEMGSVVNNRSQP